MSSKIPIFVFLFASLTVPMPVKAGVSSASADARFVPCPDFERCPDRLEELSREEKETIVKRVATQIREKYVFPELGEKMAQYLEHQQAQGIYDGLIEAKPFCAKLTSDLREISQDKHLFVFKSPEEAREVAARKGLLPPEEIREIKEAQNKADRRGNFGFGKIEILEGNIGYVAINWFSDSVEACERVIALMRYLSDTEALIIDLRDNGGGGGPASDLLMSYFFGEEKVPFSGVHWRRTNETEQSWSSGYVPGKRRPDVDLYVLVNSRTFSAAEDFSYSLQALRRAVVVGERTKGGAHPVDVVIISGDILAQISIGNSVNPITGTNWETNGVQPDVKVASEDALQVAYRRALERNLEKTPDPEYKKDLERILAKQKR